MKRVSTPAIPPRNYQEVKHVVGILESEEVTLQLSPEEAAQMVKFMWVMHNIRSGETIREDSVAAMAEEAKNLHDKLEWWE